MRFYFVDSKRFSSAYPNSILMVLPLIAARIGLKVAGKAAKLAKRGYKAAKSEAARSLASKVIKSKQATCAAKASIAEPGTKRQVYSSCMSGKPLKTKRRK